ncbi:hypothetical protein GCM10023198_58390 [Promicromonospora umidemergens]|uniref:Uncharacterized protein n=1 Tax=Promicromonospora umidemergens TaxID=629679 RepID=A0ABP8YE83_9MICO
MADMALRRGTWSCARDMSPSSTLGVPRPAGIAGLVFESAPVLPSSATHRSPDGTGALSVQRFPSVFACRAAAVLGSKLEVTITLRQYRLAATASSSDAAGCCEQVESLVGSVVFRWDSGTEPHRGADSYPMVQI